MKFDFSKHILPDGNAVYRPSLPVMFVNGKQFAYMRAFVDSGADYTILPIVIAGHLGIKLNVKEKVSFIGAGGNPFNVYKSPVAIGHILRREGFRPIKWRAYVYFAESQPAILLGNCGFLDRFKVILDGPKKEMEVLP